MNILLFYLLESTLCISVLYAIYWFFLRRDTFFMMNRYYLLAMVLFSVLLPLIPFSWTPDTPTAGIIVMLQPVLISPEKVQQTILEHLKWFEIVPVVYLTGAIIFFLRFMVQMTQIWRITRRFGINNQAGERVVFVDRGYAPFSFFNLVFISKESVPGGRLSSAILEHERVHIRQFHSIDMVLFELVTVFQWFNPVIWLAGREIKNIHEYLADEGVLQNGISRPQYQQMILDESMGIRVNNLTNNFNVSLLKKRILMMTKTKSNTWAKSKLLITLPVMLVLLFFLSARSFSIAETTAEGRSQMLIDAQVAIVPDPVIQEKPKQKTQIKYVAPVTEKEVFTVVEKQPSYPGGVDGYTKFLVENIKYPEAAMKKGVTGTVFVTFVVEKDGTVTGAKVLRGIGTGCDEEALRVVSIMPKWTPGEQRGKQVAVQFNLPIKFNLDCQKKDAPKK